MSIINALCGQSRCTISIILIRTGRRTHRSHAHDSKKVLRICIIADVAIPEIWLSKKMINLLPKMFFTLISGVVIFVGMMHYSSVICPRSYWEDSATHTRHLCARSTNLKCIPCIVPGCRWERAQRFITFLKTRHEQTTIPSARARLAVYYTGLSWQK